MQKKLIALAIAGLASSAAFAQSNVTIYGVVDASVDITNNGDTAAASDQRVNKISSNQSRIGFKGSEDLGDGLKAVFQIETAINADGTATTSMNSRNTFIGLASNSWGQILLGQYDSPYKTSTRNLDPFGDHLADNRNLTNRSRVSGLAFDSRPANTVRYDSPDLRGFKFAAAYVAGAEAANTDGQTEGSIWSLSGIYAINSEWNAIAAYQRHKFGTNNTGTLACASPTPPVACTVILPGEAEKAWKLGASYKSGALRGSFVYEKIDDDFSVAAAIGEHDSWTVAGGYTVGSNEFKVSYTMVDDFETVADSGAKQWAVGFDHVLSKRTKLYAEYVKLTNDSAAAYGLTGAGGNTTGSTAARGAGADPSAFQLGVKHSF